MSAPPARPPVEAGGLLELLRRRFSDHPVGERELRMVLEAGCWASSASNNRIHRLLLVRDRRRIDLVRAVSPGMLGLPTALVVICTDLDAAARAQVRVDRDTTTWIDVGTVAMNMMVEAEALGLGTCPTTSFSRGGVRAMLELPPPAVGVALTAETVVPGSAVGAAQLLDVETAARFCVAVATAFGAGECRFYDPAEFARLVARYGSLAHLQTLGREPGKGG